MTNEELFQKIAEMAAITFRAVTEDITRETTFKELGGKSLQTVALNSMIESELKVGVPIREVMNMKTVGELVDRVAQEL